MTDVIVLIGAGSHLVVADLRQANVDAAAKVLSEAGFDVSSDFLMDGGVTSAYWYGELAPK